MNREILHGDVLDKLAAISDETIDTIISSPPYWGLRDYSVEGQLGLEPDFHDYLNTMQKVMDGLKRVLKPTGTCWINLGDSYCGSGGGPDSFERHSLTKTWIDKSVKQLSCEQQKKKWAVISVSKKSLVGIPQRFMINCIDNGWICRNDIVWSKANSMPSSVKDRFTNKHERIFFFSKNKKYYFDLDAVRVPTTTGNYKPFNVRVRDAKNGVLHQKFGSQYSASDKEIENYDDDHITKKTREKLGKGERKYNGEKLSSTSGGHTGIMDHIGGSANNPKGKNPGDIFQVDGSDTQFIHSGQVRLTENGTVPHYDAHPKGKNPGDIFAINPQPFKEAHFATFPVDLPLKILKCACPKNGIVLDPFFGAGTVGVAAEKLGLNWIGIELNAEYIKIAQNRLSKYMNNRIEAFV